MLFQANESLFFFCVVNSRYCSISDALKKCVIKLLHNDMLATIFYNGDMTDNIEVCTRVKQRCVIASAVFSLFLTAVLHIINDDLPVDVQLIYCIDSKIFNINPLKQPRMGVLVRVSSIGQWNYSIIYLGLLL